VIVSLRIHNVGYKDGESLLCSPACYFKGIQGVGFWVFNQETGDHYTINAITFRILQLIVEGRSVKSVSRILSSEYDTNSTQATAI